MNNELEDNKFFSRGKLARSGNEPRISKASSQNRRAFNAGWDWQDDYEQRKAETPEQTEKRLAEIRKGFNTVRNQLQLAEIRHERQIITTR